VFFGARWVFNTFFEVFFYFSRCGGDVPKFEPKTRLNFAIIDKSIKKLRAIYKVHPESNRGKNEADYSIN